MEGHHGVERTLTKLEKQKQHWTNMSKHVKHFIKLCPCCQKMNQLKPVIHATPFTTSAYSLWECVSVDYIESLIEDDFGHNMIIVIIDNFSRFIDLYPAKSTEAAGAADALIKFSGRYSTPTTFRTDCGLNFKSELIRELINILGAEHELTTAYSKEENAIVERANKEILRHLRNIIFDRRVGTKWSRYLPIVQRIINTTKNSSTGYPPAQLVFPNHTTIGKSLLQETNKFAIAPYLKDLQEAQAKIIAIASQTLQAKDKKHIQEYPKERTELEEGSYVLVEHRQNSLRRGPKSKLLPFLKGPLRILKRSPSKKDIYVLQDLVTQATSDYHISKIQPFLYDPDSLTTPTKVATTDTLDEFIVEKVIKMKGSSHRPRKELMFLLRWAGYGPEDDTWERWDNCKDSEAVQQFLRTHKDKRIQRLAKKIEMTDSSHQMETDENHSQSDEEIEPLAKRLRSNKGQ